MSGPSPGWYPDPSGAPQLRWWSGSHWTHRCQPRIDSSTIPSPTVSNSSGQHQSPRAAPAIPLPSAGSRATMSATTAPIPAPPADATSSSADQATRAPATKKRSVSAIVMMVLAVCFAVGALAATKAYLSLSVDYQRSQQELTDAKEALRQAQEEGN